MIRACIFDLDGVLVDTARYHYLAWKRLAATLNINLSVEDNERLKGVSRMESLEIVLSIGHLHFNDEEKQRLADQKNEWFTEYIERMEPDEIFPGVKPLIRELRQEGIKVALASSSKNARTVINQLAIESDFDAIVDGTMIERTKPDPEIFLKAAQLVNVAPVECIVFEDAEAGVEAALRAGMKCIGIGSPAILGKATKVIEKTSDFTPQMLHALDVVIH